MLVAACRELVRSLVRLLSSGSLSSVASCPVRCDTSVEARFIAQEELGQAPHLSPNASSLQRNPLLALFSLTTWPTSRKREREGKTNQLAAPSSELTVEAACVCQNNKTRDLRGWRAWSTGSALRHDGRPRHSTGQRGGGGHALAGAGTPPYLLQPAAPSSESDSPALLTDAISQLGLRNAFCNPGPSRPVQSLSTLDISIDFLSWEIPLLSS